MANGFDYTKIANNGQSLPAGAALGIGPSDWACTRDNVTGLVWEVKTPGVLGLRAMDHTYSWYNSSSPDGSAGTANGGICSLSINYRCDTEKFVQDVNAAGLCGASDWRMPTVKELEGIADLGRSGPAIDPTYFPNTPFSYVWSGSPVAGQSDRAWLVNFYYGFASHDYRNNDNSVRLVRGGQ
ncbi:MAG: DUF1566 domain-containing protein [Proteobacteria bacterium]|nr:DUF1566 domain-containing protein [Pseudomonadota bacterium]